MERTTLIPVKRIANPAPAWPLETESPAAASADRLRVDVYQDGCQFVLYAQTPGADLDDIEIMLEGDTDVVVIAGKRRRPECASLFDPNLTGDFSTAECNWENFYRRIFLPHSVDAVRAAAKIENGVLVIVLPLLQS